MTIPTPPRLTGSSDDDLSAVIEWAWGLYRELAVQNTDRKRLDLVAAVPPLAPDAAAPQIASTVNAVIAAAKKA